MKRDNLSELQAFLNVARERSFTKAAAKMGLSQSALSHTVTALEKRLGFRLLTRTTRSVSTTEAGERLANNISPHFVQIEAELAAAENLRKKPTGTIRITTSEHAASTILWPALKKFLPRHPDIHVELNLDYGLIDIAAQRFDAGVRLGEQVAQGMIATRIGPDLRSAVVASPAYLREAGIPMTPQDLTRHRCINLRLPTHGGLYIWEFEKNNREVRVRVEGQLTFNTLPQRLDAALAGFGLVYMAEDVAKPYLANKRLTRVLEDWCPPYAGYHLYYPSRRHSSQAFTLLVGALRYEP